MFWGDDGTSTLNCDCLCVILVQSFRTYRHFCVVIGDGTVDDVSRFHAERQKIIQFCLIVIAIAAGSLDEHVKGERADR